MSFYPSYEEVIAGEDRNSLLEVRRSFMSVFSNLSLVVVLSLVVYLINYFFHDYRLPSWLPLLHHISPRWLSIFPALMLLEVLRKYHDDLYIFAAHRVTHYQGRLSLYSTLPSLKYVDILAVRVKQDVWGRILNYGNVELDTAATSGVELTMHGVRSPAELAEIVDRFRRDSISTGSIDKHHHEKGAFEHNHTQDSSDTKEQDPVDASSESTNDEQMGN